MIADDKMNKINQASMDSEVVEAEQEQLLSPELAAELGCEGNDVVLTGAKKKKRQRGGDEELSDEVKTLAKQLSKKAQKRIAQIAQRNIIL